ncbi:MAG TPA: alpha/beta hydrolase [Planctomycetota bacterium]|nr:alpha/beta hydrolase [Planctomycetota bacterium]
MSRWGGLLFLVLLGSQDGIRETRDLDYYVGDDADPRKHKLDLYFPKDAKKVPVLMWIHGGGWMTGDRSMYREVGRRFAESGIGFAAISYRLSPKVKHPAHVEDCARAFAWLLGHVADYGGDPERLFVSGQSAGGHLSALLTLDPQYLHAQKVPDGALKGSIPMSGVYNVPALPADSKGLLAMFPASFGSDPEICRAASPVSHIANLSCPMLVITESEDVGMIRPSMKLFQRAAEKAGVKDLRFIDAEQRNHISIVMNLARKTDEVRASMLDFIQKRCKDLDSK